MSMLELFCPVDGFWQQEAVQWQQTLVTGSPCRRRQRATVLHPSELMPLPSPCIRRITLRSRRITLNDGGRAVI